MKAATKERKRRLGIVCPAGVYAAAARAAKLQGVSLEAFVYEAVMSAITRDVGERELKRQKRARGEL